MAKVLKEHTLAWQYTLESLRHRRTKQRVRDRQPRYQNWFPHLNALFVHIPKTAGTSTHALLAEVENTTFGEEDKDELYFTGKKHASASEWRHLIGETRFHNAFKFCFVRNPWDLMVSSYMWWCQYGAVFTRTRRAALEIRKRSFDDFVLSDYGRYYINEWHGISMSDWFLDNGRDQMDYIGRIENYEYDITQILRQLGVDTHSVTTNHRHRTSRSNYRAYYSKESQRIIGERFSDIIQRFGYSF